MSEATIVVVEDDEHLADLVEMYLRQEGFRVVQAATGERGLEAVRSQRPRMVILGVGLPGGIDGLQVCRRRPSPRVRAVLAVVPCTRGRRGDRPRPGIVAELVAAMGGAVTAEPPPTGGTRMVVSLRPWHMATRGA